MMSYCRGAAAKNVEGTKNPGVANCLNFDLKGKRREQGKEICDIIGEMEHLKVSDTAANEKDDLLTLMDQAWKESLINITCAKMHLQDK